MRKREALKKNIEEAEAAQERSQVQYNKLLEAQASNGHQQELVEKTTGELTTQLQVLQKAIYGIASKQQQVQRELTNAETKAQTLRHCRRATRALAMASRPCSRRRPLGARSLLV